MKFIHRSVCSMPWSTINTQYRTHIVRYTQSTAYTEYGVHCILHHSIIVCLLPSASLSSCCRPCCTELSTFLQFQVNQWIESLLPGCLPADLIGFRFTASTYTSILAWSGPPSASLISLDYSLQVYLWTRSITAFKFTSRWPQSASPNWHDQGLHVHLQTRTITGAKCIFKLTWLQPPSVSANSHDYSLQTQFFMASSVDIV
jgi:hypothetical protein